MGGTGSGRHVEQRIPIGTGIFLPNYSGVQNVALKTAPSIEYDSFKFVKDYVYPTHQEVTSEGVLVEDFETIGDWTAAGTGATQEATTDCKSGTYALKLNAVNGNASYSTKTINQDFSAATNFAFWIYVDTATFTGDCAIYFSSVTNWSKFYIKTFFSVFHTGWNRLVIDRAQFTTSTAEDWANVMIRMRVRMNPGAGQSSYTIWDDFRTNYTAKAKCIITFDDGWQNIYDKAYPIMYANNQKGVEFIIPDHVGTTNYMTFETIQELYANGWDIGNHSYSHQYLTTLSDANMHTEIDSADSYLSSFASRRIFAYPFGYKSQAIIDYLKSRNFIFARTTINGQFQPHLNLTDDAQYNIKIVNVINTMSTATAQAYIDEAIVQGGLLVLLFHQIVDAGATESTQYLTADFQTISDYLVTKLATIDVETFSKYFAGFSRFN